MRCAFRPETLALAAVAALLGGCRDDARRAVAPPRRAAAQAVAGRDGVPPIPGGMRAGPIANPFAYIPAACWTNTRDASGGAVNPCYTCHVDAAPPNFADDGELQLELRLPPAAAENPWRNLFAPPGARVVGDAGRDTDADILAYVRRDNYFDGGTGEIALARDLATLPPLWDGDGDGHWNGYRPDAYFRFDARGFDHRPGATPEHPEGAPTGWRAYAYTPVPGFFPTNGAFDDALIRLDAPYREDARGVPDARVYEINLAIVEALIKRADVTIDPTDERALGVDLDLDGTLTRDATRVAFDGGLDGGTRMRWVGRAGREAIAGRAPIAVGLFPLGTELLHSLRYLDVRGDGTVAMAARMKELRYARKARWLAWADLRSLAAIEKVEHGETPERPRQVLWKGDHGVWNGQGWLLQGFIEAADGRLRPQSYEESVTCAGCHGGVGATADSTFSFARKLGTSAPARGWFHPTQRDLGALPEPRRRDGRWEYTLYLTEARAGDDLRENDEVRRAFFDDRGHPRADRIERLHADVTPLLLPSPARALALDRASRALTQAQRFDLGREVALAPATNVARHATIGATGLRPVQN